AGIADRVNLAEEVVRSRRTVTSLIMKADLVRHRVIPEYDPQFVATLGDLPGAIEHLGMADVAPAVTPYLAVGRTAEDLLVGGDPLDSVSGQERDHLLADRALARPHPSGTFAEMPYVRLDGAADMDLGIVGIAVPIAGQVD